MKAVLSCRWFQLVRNKSLWGLILLILILTAFLEKMMASEIVLPMGRNFFTKNFPPFPDSELAFRYQMLAAGLSGGGTVCLLGAAIGGLLRSRTEESMLPVLAAGHSKRQLLWAESLLGLGLGAVSLILLEGLEVLIFRTEFMTLFAWNAAAVAGMLGLRLLLAMGNVALFLALSAVLRREIVLLLAMLLAAMELLSAGIDLTGFLPAGGLSGIFLGTTSGAGLLLRLGEMAVCFAACFFVPQERVQRE